MRVHPVALTWCALVAFVPSVPAPAGARPGLGSFPPSRSRPPAAVPVERGSVCVNPQRSPFLQGRPHLVDPPTVQSVRVSALKNGVEVQYRFARRLPSPPEGVYFSWSVWLYHHRGDATVGTKGTDLQIEDRGPGWEPSGWAVSASTYSDNTPVEGQVVVNRGRTALETYFPPGFVDLRPPLYWYASQELYRAYLPSGPAGHRHKDYTVNGSVTTDCPSGVRRTPYALPDPSRLLSLR